MKTLLTNIIFMVLLAAIYSVYGYTNLTPAEVHNRLVEGDTLLILDVREVFEYKTGHIAEPMGQLPLTPINMPWNSNVLSTEYHRLPNNIDILVHCRSGGRSAAASSFLESNGFTRIYNMTGGFNSWTYEYRENGFGDHSGRWVRSSDIYPVTIICSATGDTSKIILPPNALPVTDSIYMELHFASSQVLVPPNVPQSDLEGLFRITALNRFGLSTFDSDSLALFDTVLINLLPNYQGGEIINSNMTVYVPGEGWRIVSCYFDSSSFYRNEMILRRWYNVEGYINTGIVAHPYLKEYVLYQNYPNPFNPSTTIEFSIPKSEYVSLKIYNLLGQEVENLVSKKLIPGNYKYTWNASQFASGVHFYKLEACGFQQVKKLVLMK